MFQQAQAPALQNERMKRFNSVQSSEASRLASDPRYKYMSPGNPLGVVPIISIEHADMLEHVPGVLFEATIPVAARAIARRTHKIATDEEYAEFRAMRAAIDSSARDNAKVPNQSNPASVEQKRVGRPKNFKNEEPE